MPKQMPSELLSRVVGVRSFRLIFATDAREAMINNIEDIFIVVKISWMKTKVFPRWRLIDLIFDIFISLAFFFSFSNNDGLKQLGMLFESRMENNVFVAKNFFGQI